MNYYVIHCSEDGDKSIDVFTKDKLEEALKDEDWGENPEFGDPGTVSLDYFSGLLIIKGETVIPKPVELVKSYSV